MHFASVDDLSAHLTFFICVHAGKDPLSIAVSSGDVSEVSRLLQPGCSGNKPWADANGSGVNGPYIVKACTLGHIEIVTALLEAGANPNETSAEGLPGIFVVAACAAMKLKQPGRVNEANEIIQAFELLLQRGAKPDTAAPGGFTPLHVAAEIGSERMVHALLDAGADTSASTAEGQTPAAIAASWGHRDIAQLLLRHDATGNSVDDLVEAEKKREAERRTQRANVKEGKPAESHVPNPDEEDEDKAKALQREGNVAFVKGDYATALEKYRMALGHWTASAVLWSDASAAALRQGYFEDALRDARVARTVDPKAVKAWLREGKAAEALKMWEDAAAAYFEAYLLQPTGMAGSSPEIDFGELVKNAVERGKVAHQQRAEINQK
jgi:tetratricopeptide (TPR) repeat protein